MPTSDNDQEERVKQAFSVSPAPSQPPKRQHFNIELTVFGFLVSLAVNAALATAYGGFIPKNANTVQTLNHYLLALPTGQILIFLLTVVRFVYGAYRFQEEGSGQRSSLSHLWSLIGTLLLFVLFYITGLAVLHADTFYTGMVYVHVWDFIWLAGLICFFKAYQAITKNVIVIFMIIDFVTVVSLWACQKYWHAHFMGKAETIMVLLAGLDMFWNREFFFSPDQWREHQDRKRQKVRIA